MNSVKKFIEAVAWFTDDHLTDKSATTFDPVVAERWRNKGWPVTNLYAAPVTAAPVDSCRCIDCGGDQPGHSSDCAWMTELHGTPAAPEGFVMVPVEPTEFMLWAADEADDEALSHGAMHGADNGSIYRTMIDASPKGALPTLPDDFSESKDWRAGSYGERVEWLMDTVRSQREHIEALLDSTQEASDAR